MKLFKLQMLTAKFESIKMKEDETFTTLYLKLSEIVISSFNLGEKILDYNSKKNFEISPYEIFKPKVTTTDIDSLRVDELIGSS